MKKTGKIVIVLVLVIILLVGGIAFGGYYLHK